MCQRPGLLPATLRFSLAVNCWTKAKNRGLKKSCKAENRIEKECFLIRSQLLLSVAVILLLPYEYDRLFD